MHNVIRWDIGILTGVGSRSSDKIRANRESLEWGGLCYVFGTKVFVVSVYFFYFCF